jgi:putative redox protein
MALKTAIVTLDGDGLRFNASAGSGHSIVLDSGEGDMGMRPSELIPVALAGCTGMDVISILRKKRQAVSGYRIEVGGTQTDAHPNAFTRMDVTHVVEGVGVDVDAVSRAIELSATKYCAVGATLASGNVEIHHGYRVIDTATGAEAAGDVLVEGPHQDPSPVVVATAG